MIVVGYYTPDGDYPAMAERMRRSVAAQGLDSRIYSMPTCRGYAELAMRWVAHCAYCPAVILMAMVTHPETAILYLDADAEMLRFPSLLTDDSWAKVQVAYPVLNNTRVKNRLMSNTLYFDGSCITREIVKVWKIEQERRILRMRNGQYKYPYREAWDQQVLQDVLADFNVVTRQLPYGYAYIEPVNQGGSLCYEVMPLVSDVVIRQHQAGRKSLRKISV